MNKIIQVFQTLPFNKLFQIINQLIHQKIMNLGKNMKLHHQIFYEKSMNNCKIHANCFLPDYLIFIIILIVDQFISSKSFYGWLFRIGSLQRVIVEVSQELVYSVNFDALGSNLSDSSSIIPMSYRYINSC